MKPVFALLASALIPLALAACGSTASPGDGGDAPTTDSAPDASVLDVSADVALDVPADVALDAASDVPADRPSVGDACGAPPSAGAIGQTCDPANNTCPAGYVCQPFSGAILAHSCQIRCESGCPCPTGTTCRTVSDKGGSWLQCAP